MGLETDITDIQSLNQNWPPVSDPRAQGADHIRNIKKAIQLTFPNLKQCLLNDAQFTALGTLIGDGSGTFTVNGKLTVSDTLTVKGALLVPAVTDWTTEQAVGAKDAEGRYLKPGDADGRYLKPGDADGRYVASTVGGGDAGNIQQVTFNTTAKQISAQTRDGTWHFAQPAGDYATTSALNTETTNRTNADTNLQNQINNRVLKSGDTMTDNLCSRAYKTFTGGNFGGQFFSIIAGQSGGDSGGDYSFAMWMQQVNGQYTGGILSVNGFKGRKDFRFNEDGNIFTPLGTVALTSQLPFTDQNLRVQVWVVDSCSNADTITIPSAFSSTLGVIAQDMTPASRYSSINPVKINTDLMSGNQFRVQIWSGGTSRRVLFVAYGYF